MRSAGTSEQARRKISSQDLEWADLVLVMEHAHKKRILQEFHGVARNCKMFVLDIPDEFEFMDASLVELIRGSVEPILAGSIDV